MPLGSSTLDEGPYLRPPQAEVHHRVQTLLAVKYDAVHVLSVQHELRGHQVDLQQQSPWCCIAYRPGFECRIGAQAIRQSDLNCPGGDECRQLLLGDGHWNILWHYQRQLM